MDDLLGRRRMNTRSSADDDAGGTSEMPGVADIQTAMEQARGRYHRLVLLVGPSGSGKTGLLRSFAAQAGRDCRNVNLEISQRMLELPKLRRARQADRIFRDWVAATGSDPLVLDNLEVLFDSGLQLDPLRLLQASSRNHTLVASWSGTLHDGVLVYAEPDHPEYRVYRDVAAVTVTMGHEPQDH